MAISRPFLLAVLGAVLLGATVLAVQNARDTTNSDATPAAIQNEAAPAPSQTTATTDAADTLNAGLNLKDLHRARFEAHYNVVDGATKTRFSFQGAFDSTGDTAIPRFRVTTRVRVNDVKATGTLVSLGDRAYFVSGNTGWRVPAALWGPFGDKVASGEQMKLPVDIHPAGWVRDVKSKGTERIAGVETEHLTARVDVPAMLNDLGTPVGSGSAKEKTLERNIKRARLDLWIGKDDHILRRFDGQLVGRRTDRLEFDLRLADVNEAQRIEAPAHVRVGAPSGAAGAFAEFVTRQVGGSGTPSIQALASPNPGRAARAVRHHKKVVILFRNNRGLDDQAMASVLRSVDARTKALVLSDPVDAVDRYGKLLQDLGVNETPSVVIIDSRGKAKLIEGYVDSDTLTQAVTDAR